MKKLLLSSLLATSIFTFAYTDTDVSNASFLSDQGIIVKQGITSNYRLDSTITRAEAIGIALKIKGVTLPESYTCKKYFSDTTTNDWKCRAIELAADNGIITRNNTKARPNDTITRAEALAIVMKAKGLGITNQSQLPSPFPWRDLTVDWQTVMLNNANIFGIIPFPDSPERGASHGNWYPNRAASRAEVFGFAKNILEYKVNNISGETEINNFSIKDGKLYNNNQLILDKMDGKSLVDSTKFCNPSSGVYMGGQWFSSLEKIHAIDGQVLAVSYLGGVCEGGISQGMMIIDTKTLLYRYLHEYKNTYYPNNVLQISKLSKGIIYLNIFGGDGILDLNTVGSDFNKDTRAYEQKSIYFQRSTSLSIDTFLKK